MPILSPTPDPAPSTAEPHRSWSLRALAVALVGLLLTAIALVAVPLLETRIRNDARQADGEEAMLRAQYAARSLDGDIADRVADLHSRALIEQMLALRNDPARQRAWLDTIQQGFPAYAWIGFVWPDGKVNAATGAMLEGQDVSERPWFVAGLEDLTTQDVHDARLLAGLLPRDDGQPARFIDIAVPVRDADGRVVGVLGAHLHEQWLRGRLARLRSLAGEAERQIQVVGPDDLPRLTRPGTKPAPLHLESVRRARAGDRGWLVETWPDGRRYLVGWAGHAGADTFKGFGWVTLVRQPADVDTPAVQTAVRALRVGAALTVLLAVLATLLAATVMLRPVHAFERRMRLLDREGDDRDGRPDPLPRWTPRELRALGDTVASLLGHLRDERRRLAGAYAELDASFRGVGAQFPGVLFSIEADPRRPMEARFRYASPSAERYFGVEPGEVLDKPANWSRNVNPADRGALLDGIRTAIEENRAWDARFRITGSDGVERWMRVEAAPRPEVPAPGEPVVWDGLALDITALVQERARAESADAAKGAFLATMSHELRTPLNGINGYATLIEQDAQEGAQREHARALRESSQMLARILDDVLDFSKIEAGRMELENVSFRPDVLVTECAAGWRAHCEARGLQFELSLPDAPLPALSGDPVRLRQILNNLLSNALKFTLAGRIVLRVTAQETGTDSVRLRLAVADSGIGMTAAQRERLFRRFEQADASINRRFGGTGLGMSIVKGLVDAMGGTIDCHSVPGVGTTFVVELPLAPARAAESGPSVAAATVPAPGERPPRPLRVLVVDDMPLNRRVLGALLARHGHVAIEAADGEQALERFREEGADLVLMDVDMPVMDGLEATRRLRALTAHGGDRVPVHALTGNVFDEDRARALEAGMDGVMAKPVRHEELAALLAKVGTSLAA